MLANESPEDYFARVKEQAMAPQTATDGGGYTLDILDVLEPMATHYHEHHAAIIAWGWPLFCRKWVRLIAWSAEEHERQADQETKRERAALQAEHRQKWG